MYKPKTISELNQLYTNAESCDQSLFSEQRSNVLLANGEHYSKKQSIYWSRIRDNSSLSEETRLRITKNHIHRICNIYINNIYAIAPDVAVLPKNEKLLHDQKAAELRSKIWQDWKEKSRLRERIRSLISDFIIVGEVGVKITFNPNSGRLLGYEQAPILDDMGFPTFDEMGMPKVKEGKPVFEGSIELEQFFTANLLRDPNGKTFYDTPWIIRKMVDCAPLKERYKDTEKEKFVAPTGTSGEYTVFDGNNGGYYKTKDQVLIKEYYFHPSEECPEGYFYITTEAGILEEGPLPFGVFPIVMEGFDEIITSPRKRSLIKQLRPVQAELNRAASQSALHQITVGDDKLLVQTGTKIQPSSKLPGMRVVTYAGVPPTFLSGRTGDQFINYIEMQQRELYEIANLQEELQEKQTGNIDPQAELFKAIRHKKKYVLYAEKFYNFLSRICEITLELSRHYYSDEKLAEIFGPDDIANIIEFRNPKGATDIKLVEQSEDVESKMGKQLSIMSVLQYAGTKLERDDLGKLLRSMPFLNKEAVVDDFTTDFDNIQNDILALDRGEIPTPNKYENHKYVITKFVNRTKRPGFETLHPQIQKNYFDKIQLHEQFEQQQLDALKAMEADFIPASGQLVKVDVYRPNPNDPNGTPRRATLPIDSINWLMDRLEKQGIQLAELEKVQQGAVAEMAGNMISNMARGTMNLA